MRKFLRTFCVSFFAEADSLFDMDRSFEYLDKELEQLFPPQDGEYAPRFVDKLVKVFRRMGPKIRLLSRISKNLSMMRIFEQEVEQLAGRSTTMGIEQYLLEREKQRGLQKGKLEGEHEKAIAIALEMKKEGMSAAQISKFTKLSEEEIGRL